MLFRSAFHNGHMYYVVVNDPETRTALLASLGRQGINAVFHYIPLHSSAAGVRYGRAAADLPVTRFVSDRLLRLPLWAGMSVEETGRVTDAVRTFYGLAGVAPRGERSVAADLLERRAV